MITIYYYHGLDSFLSDNKRKILEQHGNVIAIKYNYRAPGVLNELVDSFNVQNAKECVVIGSSFGGYVAQMLSQSFNLPCLLFNPALAFRNIDNEMNVTFETPHTCTSYIVLGRKDEVIDCNENIKAISTFIKGPQKIHIEEDMGHRIPEDIFKKHVQEFFELLSENSIHEKE